MNKLKKEVSNFVATYYLIFPGPEETEASRRQRMAPKVSATVLSRLNFGLKIATVAGIRRTQDKLIQKGQALTDQLRVGKDSSDKAALYVSVPVRLYLVDKDDKEVVSYLPIATVSKWRYSDGAWHLLGFSEGDDAE